MTPWSYPKLHPRPCEHVRVVGDNEKAENAQEDGKAGDKVDRVIEATPVHGCHDVEAFRWCGGLRVMLLEIRRPRFIRFLACGGRLMGLHRGNDAIPPTLHQNLGMRGESCDRGGRF